MHSASIITLLSAASMVVATPLHQLFHKRVLVTDIVTDIVVVTVTATGPAPPPAAATVMTTVQAPPKKQHTHTRSAAAPPPSSAAPSVVIVTESAAPASTPPASTIAEVKAVSPVSSAAPASSAPASSAVAAVASKPTDYASTATFNHNQHRANHTASDLAWNQTLADWAAITAKTCHFAHDMDQGTKNYGQNIAAYGVSSGVPDASKVLANAITDMWYYGEVGVFPFGTEISTVEQLNALQTGPEFLHFSQAVWKGTQSVGCATQTCSPNTVLGGDYQSTYTVCNYFPAGNMLGSFVKQVTPSADKVGTLAASI